MTKQFLTYQEFLNEGLNSSRKSFLITGKINPEDFDRLTLLDTTTTKKYLDSICRFFLEGHSEEEIKTYIDKFNTLGFNLPKKDINLYSFEELKNTLDSYTSKNQKDKLATKDIEVVYKDERFFIVRPDTFEQSAKYGRDTKWCITATDGTGQGAWKTHRYDYLLTFYFITDKSLPSTDPLYKVAIAVDEYGEIEKGKNTTVNSLNEEIDGEDYIRKNMLPRELFVPRELTVLEKWKIDLSKLKDGVYDGDIEAPEDIKEFRGFKELFGFDIKEVQGYLSFYGCISLTSVSNLPEKIGGSLSFRNCTILTSLPDLPEYVGDYLDFEECTSLTSISKMPSFVGNTIYTYKCPFFENLTEEQIREKYNISEW